MKPSKTHPRTDVIKTFRMVVNFLLACALLLPASLSAAAAPIELCTAPLLLHLRRPASESVTAAMESFELCHDAAQTEFLPMQKVEGEEPQLFAPGVLLQLTRTSTGMRVQLRLGKNLAEALELRSNAPEQVVRWKPLAGVQVNQVPKLLMRVERRPAESGLSRQLKILMVDQPAEVLVHEVVKVAQLDLSGLDLLCRETFTVNFEAVAVGVLLRLAADVCYTPLRDDGKSLRFVRASEAPGTRPTFADRAAELKYDLSLAERDGASVDAEESLLALAELALARHHFAAARAYLARLRALPRSWFGTSGTKIDIALARVELQAAEHQRAKRLLDKVLRALDQSDPDQISEERLDALVIRAQLYAAEGQHLQAQKMASEALVMNEQVWDYQESLWKREDLLLAILKTSKEASSK